LGEDYVHNNNIEQQYADPYEQIYPSGGGDADNETDMIMTGNIIMST